MVGTAPSTGPDARGLQRRQGRIPGLDLGRGLIVALMALDHVRIFLANAQFDPVDLAHTTPAWFAVRWVTHLCAPGFFFLAGMGVSLLAEREQAKSVGGYLVTRGLMLMALEFLVFGFAWSFNPGWYWFGVIWGLGSSMLLLAACIRLPRLAVGGLGLLLVLLLPLAGSVTAGGVRALLVTGGMLDVFGANHLVIYPVLPWAALMLIGYAVTPLFVRDGRLSTSRLAAGGLLLVLGFALCRWSGIGGGAPDAIGMMAFLNVQKYPPSLQFSTATLGCLLLAMAAANWAWKRGGDRFLAPLETFGRVPFFFYLVHLYLIHIAALATAGIARWDTDYLFWRRVGPNLIPPDGYGLSVAGVILAWLLVLFCLYWPCAWYAGLKRRHDGWLLRLA